MSSSVSSSVSSSASSFGSSGSDSGSFGSSSGSDFQQRGWKGLGVSKSTYVLGTSMIGRPGLSMIPIPLILSRCLSYLTPELYPSCRWICLSSDNKNWSYTKGDNYERNQKNSGSPS